MISSTVSLLQVHLALKTMLKEIGGHLIISSKDPILLPPNGSSFSNLTLLLNWSPSPGYSAQRDHPTVDEYANGSLGTWQQM